MSEGFRPRKKTKSEMDEIIQDCIEGVISQNADVIEIRFWASAIPEALRYCYRKRKKVERLLEETNNRLAELDAKCKLVYIHSSKAPNASITEKKDFAESMKIAKTTEYKELKQMVAMYNELINGIDADIINLEQKSYMIRKMSNIETTNRVFYDD